MMRTATFPRLATALAATALLAASLPGCVPLVVGGAAVAGAGLVATDRRSSGAQLDDQTIELRGAARIRDIANDDMNVTVTSYNHQVLLTGTVGNEADRRRAEEVVQGTENVRSVVNALTVGPARTFQEHSNDLYITGRVKASLLDAKDLFANAFKVVTEQGTVYLMGLATRRETDRATEIARTVPGVQKVVRMVEIVSDADLAGSSATGAGAPVSNAGASAPGGNVPLPPMEPLPPAGGGAVATPVR